MVRLFLIRHAETRMSGPRRLRGPESAQDVLREAGPRQAISFVVALAAQSVPDARVYFSPYLRAQQAAQTIATALDAPLTVLPNLHEMEPGHWTGQPQSALSGPCRQLFGPQGEFAFPGGESERQVARPTRQALEIGGHAIARDPWACPSEPAARC